MLHINDIVHRVAGRTLLDGATLALEDGMRAGLVGRNGTGKTTLLRLVAGESEPESGEIHLRRGARLGRVAQEAPGGPTTLLDFVLAANEERAALLAEAETARDAARIAEIQTRLVDIDAHSAPARAATILSGLGFDTAAQGRTLSEFSGGWRMRVALAAILFSEPDVLLLDEPTNYLDLEGTLWLQSFLASYPRASLIVSHDRDLLNTAVDFIVHLKDGRLSLYRGGYDSFERQRAEQQALQLKLKKKQDDQRRHISAFVERFRYKATKARQAQSRLKILERMQPIAAEIEGEVLPFRMPAPEKALSPPIIRMDGAAAGYGETPVLSRLDLRIDPDDRIGLLGANGNGKSTFAKLLSGRLDAMDGNIWRADKLTVAYFAQHQVDELDPSASAVQAVRRLMPDATEAQVRSRTAQIGFGPDKADTPSTDLSGGEKARLLLGLVAFHGPHLIILDEPTNHLDIDSREALIRALNDYAGAVILISHDRHLLEACADRFWLVGAGGVQPFDGDLDEYRDLLLGRSRGGNDDGKPKSTDRRRAADRRNALTPLRDRVRKAEGELDRMRKAIELIDRQLADPDLFARDPQRGGELAKLRAEAERRIERAETVWLEASEALEQAKPG